ncbi:protein kinase [bacterium]|nr:protein kinase [candidate division CSSED10-310 bacterium]
METIQLGSRTYQVHDRLGRGGTCEVFKIVCDETQDVHALKVLLGSQNARRFRREFRSMARLDHPNIAQVYEYGEYDDRPCYSMEFIAGGDMKNWLRKEMGIVSTGTGQAPSHPDDFKRLVTMFIEICHPLSYIHSKKILHRDLKPANIMLTDTGEIRLMDFGLIKELDIIQETLTRTGTFVGTVAYMSPEQGMGRHLDPRSDLYSFGVILYEALSGRLPFLGSSVVQVLMKHINSPPEPPTTLNPSVPLHLERLTLALLQKEPSARPASADEVLDQLMMYLKSGSMPIMETMESIETGETPDLSMPVTGTPGLLVPGLIGREGEMDIARSAMENLRRGTPGIVSVVGELGTGKSAFVKEVGTSARMHGFSLLRGACTEVERFPYGAFIRPLESIADRLAVKDVETIQKVIGHVGPILASICPAFNQIAILKGLPPVEPLEPLQAKLRNFDAIRSVFENFSRDNGLVLIVEDLQWADDLSYELIHYLARNLCRTDRRPPSLLLIQTWRPEDLPKVGVASQFRKNLITFPCHQEVNLKPLSRESVAQMIVAMLGDRDVHPGVFDEVFKDSGGNPFFIEEIVKNLINRSILRKTDGQWVLDLSDTVDSLPAVTVERLSSTIISVPNRVRDIISQRLDKLDEEIRQALRIASVIGIEFEFDLLLAVSGAEEDELLDQLDEAMKEDIIEEVKGSGGEVFRFRQNMIRQVLYNGLSERRLGRIHRKVAEAILRETGEDDPEVFELLAFHFDRGGCIREAIPFYLRASERALAFAAESSMNYANRVMELIDSAGQLDDTLIQGQTQALRLKGRSNELTGNPDAAVEAYSHLLKLGEDTGRPAIEGMGLQYMAGILSDRGQYHEAIEMYARCLSITADKTENNLLRANVMAEIASVYMNQGRYQESIKVLDIVRRKMAKIQNLPGIAMCELTLGLCHYYQGDYSQSLDLLTSAVDRYKRMNHQYQAVKALNNIGGIYHAKGDTLKAMEYFSQSVEISRKTSDLYSVGAIQGNLGVLYHERGLFNRAAASLEEALSISRKLGDRPGITTSLLNLAALRMDQGELRKPLAMLEEAERLAQEMGDKYLTVYTLSLQGDLFLHYGDLLSSRQKNERCRQLAAEIGLRSQEIVAGANLAWICARHGEIPMGIEQAVHAVQSAESLGDSDSLLRSRFRLSEIYLLAARYDDARRSAAPGVKLARKRGYIMYQWQFAACVARAWFDRGDYDRAFPAFRMVIQVMTAMRKQLEPQLMATFFAQPLVRHLLEDIRETSEILQKSDTWATVVKLLDLSA